MKDKMKAEALLRLRILEKDGLDSGVIREYESGTVNYSYSNKFGTRCHAAVDQSPDIQKIIIKTERKFNIHIYYAILSDTPFSSLAMLYVDKDESFWNLDRALLNEDSPCIYVYNYADGSCENRQLLRFFEDGVLGRDPTCQEFDWGWEEGKLQDNEPNVPVQAPVSERQFRREMWGRLCCLAAQGLEHELSECYYKRKTVFFSDRFEDHTVRHVDLELCEELKRAVQEVENIHDVRVYYVALARRGNSRIATMLYVENDPKEWDDERDFLIEGHPNAYTYDLKSGQCERDEIRYKFMNECLVRTA